MSRPTLSIRLRERLGQEAAQDLESSLDDVKADMLLATHERFEARLAIAAAELKSDLRQDMASLDAGLRTAMTEGFATLRAEMADMRVDILRWSFLFWVGQLAATLGLLAIMLRR